MCHWVISMLLMFAATFDAMEVGVPDGPRANEILFALAMTKGPRIHNRMGGLTMDEVKGEDGLR